MDAQYHFLKDVDGDSIPEIIFGSYGPGNGAVYKDTRDSNGYLQAVSLDGERLWSLERKGPHGGFYVAPGAEREDEPPFVMALSCQNSASGDSAQLMKINARTGEIILARNIYLRTQQDFITPWCKTADGRLTYLVSLEYPRAGLFTEQLDLIRVFDDFPILLAQKDVNDDGRREYLGTRNGDTIEILDSTLAKMVEHRSALSGIKIQRRKQMWGILWLTSGFELRRAFIKVNPLFDGYRLRWWATVIGSTLGAIALFAGSVYGTRYVIQARQAIKQARRQREQMNAMTAVVQTMGHEMKTPLDLLSDATFYLERELSRQEDDRQEIIKPFLEDFRYVQGELRDRSLELQKFVGLTALQFSPFNFGELVRKVVTSEFRRPDVEFKLDIAPDLPLLTADQQQLKRVVRNLVKNSLKAMKVGGSLKVCVEMDLKSPDCPADGRWIQLIVEDSGCGIPPEDLKKVFDPSYSHFDGGSGLGLAIVKKAVDDHQGQIEITSILGHGTKVRVRLPLKRQEES